MVGSSVAVLEHRLVVQTAGHWAVLKVVRSVRQTVDLKVVSRVASKAVRWVEKKADHSVYLMVAWWEYLKVAWLAEY